MLKRKSYAAVMFLLLLVSIVTASQRPHIVVIVADDLGYNDVSFHGSDQIPTRNIDKLAYEGVILSNYYVSPICTPTRSALMTGRYPIHTGMQVGVIRGAEPYGLPLNVSIMPQRLGKLGYRTHMVGKWHLGFHHKEYTPTYRGFESFVGYYQGCGDYYDHSYEANEKWFGFDFRRNTSLDYSGIGEYSTTIFTREAVRVISDHNKQEPLFLYLPYQAVHSGNLRSGKNLQAPSSYVKRHPHIANTNRKNYAGMVAALDDGVGAVVDALRKKGLYNNSVIIFTTDNGGPANGFDGNAASNYPLRGVKATLWEGGVRGVGFVHSPLLDQKGYKSQQLIHVSDWLPTLYTAAGGSVSDLGNIDGIDQWNTIKTNGKPVRHELLHNINPANKKGAIRVGDYKLLIGGINMHWDGWYPPYQYEEDSQLLRYDNPIAKNIQRKSGQDMGKSLYQLRGKPAVVTCGERPSNASTNCIPQNAACLYHIPSDPCEYHNIADTHPDIVKQLMDRLNAYEASMVPPLNKPQDPKGNPRLNNGAWVPWLDKE